MHHARCGARLSVSVCVSCECISSVLQHLTSLAHQQISIPEHLQPREHTARPELRRIRRRQAATLHSGVDGRRSGGRCDRLLLRRLLGGFRIGRCHGCGCGEYTVWNNWIDNVVSCLDGKSKSILRFTLTFTYLLYLSGPPYRMWFNVHNKHKYILCIYCDIQIVIVSVAH